MKVLAFVLIISVAAVCALPLEENGENENVNVLSEAEPSDADINLINEMIRDKRQYGGNEKIF